jgi:putative spermidine/putrescine transport system substrate-binding protein
MVGRTAIHRRAALGSAIGLSAVPSLAQTANASPVAMNIMDVAGNLQLTKVGIERFRTATPGLVSKITYGLAHRRNCQAS